MTGHKSRPSCTSWFSLQAESYEYLISFSSLSASLCILHANLLHAGGVNHRRQRYSVYVIGWDRQTAADWLFAGTVLNYLANSLRPVVHTSITLRVFYLLENTLHVHYKVHSGK